MLFQNTLLCGKHFHLKHLILQSNVSHLYRIGAPRLFKVHNHRLCARNVLKRWFYSHGSLSGSHCYHPFQRDIRYQIHTQSACFCSSSSESKTGSDEIKFCSDKNTLALKKSELKRLFKLAEDEKWRLAGGVSLLFVSSAVSMAVPFCMGRVIDLISTAAHSQDMLQSLTGLCSIFAGIFIVGGFANFGRVYLMQLSGQNIVNRLRQRLFSSIMRQEVAFYDHTKTGELINRLSADTTVVGQAVTMNISDGLRSLAHAGGGIGMMVYVSPKLALISMGIVPPVAIIAVIYGRYLRSITKQVQDSLAGATQVAEERISNVRTVRAFAQELKECEAYNEKISYVLKLAYKEALARGIFFGTTGLAGNLIVLSVLYYGGHMMTESQMTVGNLSAFLLYAAYVGMAVGGMSSFYSETMRGLGASSRLWQLMDRKPAIPIHVPTSTLVSPVIGHIEFSHLHFSYPVRKDAPIFTDLCLSLPAGSVTAVVGASGSGKSTLGVMLLRFYDPHQGKVTLDGQDIRHLDPMHLRSVIGTVSQEPVLFSTTIAENIAYGMSDASLEDRKQVRNGPSHLDMEQIRDAAQKANALQFILGFPAGFQTLVGERGLTLSGGQRQRVAIARAIIKDPKILLLDEATSALDAESEFLVQEALERVMLNRTVIVIAHRLSTIKTADQIAVLHKGQIAELGSYSQLINIPDGRFRKLVERQTIMS